MRKSEVLILGREDLIEISRTNDITTINFIDFKPSLRAFRDAEIVLFIDDNGYTKILKNRFGDLGNHGFTK